MPSSFRLSVSPVPSSSSTKPCKWGNAKVLTVQFLVPQPSVAQELHETRLFLGYHAILFLNTIPVTGNGCKFHETFSFRSNTSNFAVLQLPAFTANCRRLFLSSTTTGSARFGTHFSAFISIRTIQGASEILSSRYASAAMDGLK